MAYYLFKYSNDITNVLPKGAAATALAVGDLVYMNSSGQWAKATAAALTATTRTDALGVVPFDALQYEDVNPLRCCEIEGYSSMTIGAKYYLSGATAGAATATEPSTDYIRQVVGVAVSATRIRFDVEEAALDVGGDLCVDSLSAGSTISIDGTATITSVIDLKAIPATNLFECDATGNGGVNVGSMVKDPTTQTAAGSIKIKVGATTYEIPFYATA